MKFGLLKYKESINLGDEIQSIAARQYLPRVDEYLDRDYLNLYEGNEPVKLILNGWYMAKPENWPPCEAILPLFISFHLSNSSRADKMLTDPAYKTYYKKHEPIGCRDWKTVRLFQSMGVEAYYSGCLTLTLPARKVDKTDQILLVDPFYKLPEDLREKYINQLIPRKEEKNIVRIDQHDSRIMSVQERFDEADRMLDRYAAAKLVFTSRIHCALPCLALGTPVYFLDSGFEEGKLRDRFDGVLDLMRTLDKSYFPFPDVLVTKKISKYVDISRLYNMKRIPDIDWENPSPNPFDISHIQEQLRSRVLKFMENDFS